LASSHSVAMRGVRSSISEAAATVAQSKHSLPGIARNVSEHNPR
jgi:hypothetical protein